MNKGRSFEDRWNHFNNKLIKLQPSWVQAFIDGEGTFQFLLSDQISRQSKYVAANPTLEIAQNSHEVFVLNAIIKYLGIGYLKPKYNILSLEESKSSRSVSRAVFNQFDIIINFVDNYPMLTCKQLDYIDWRQIVELKKLDAHKTEEGKQIMIELKLGMNRGRLLNSNLLDSSDKFKIMRDTGCGNDTLLIS